MKVKTPLIVVLVDLFIKVVELDSYEEILVVPEKGNTSYLFFCQSWLVY